MRIRKFLVFSYRYNSLHALVLYYALEWSCAEVSLSSPTLTLYIMIIWLP